MMTSICRAMLLAALPLALATPAFAQDSAERNVRFGGVPRIGSSDGWSIKPRGRIQLDVGNISSPEGIDRPGLGGVGEMRRGQLGVEGTMPGGLSFLFDVDFASGIAEITDATVTWKASPSVAITVGQHNNFQALEELTSDRFNAFMERAAFTDAFNFTRRLGVSTEITHGPLIAQIGVFGDNFLDLDDGARGRSVDGRLVYAPKIGETQLHFGASAHLRDNGDLAENGFTARFRQRPLLHATDVRFIDTRALAVEDERRLGLEAAVIRGPFSLSGEAHWLRLDIAAPDPNQTLFGGYAELGWSLTGEARGYKGGRWDRTRVRRAIGEGGIGAIQLFARYDYLDLNAGGIQNGFQAGITWIPTDYVRFLINYARLDYEDAAIPAANGNRDYAVDVVGARAQIDF
jgi:phosphate-selective porin OprO/OprP